MIVFDLVIEIKRVSRGELPRLSEPTKRALKMVFDALNIELVFCKWCDKPLVPKKKGNVYCNDSCSDADWNKIRRT